jgi:hypothetical protein
MGARRSCGQLLMLKMMMIEVKAASLPTVFSLKDLQSNHKVTEVCSSRRAYWGLV